MPDRSYDFVNAKISTGIDGIARIFLPNARAIGALTARGTRDFVATVGLASRVSNGSKQAFIDEIYLNGHFRGLSTRDYARLQGFPADFRLAASEAIAKRQLGNAVAVPVVYHLAVAVLKAIDLAAIDNDRN